MAQNRPAPCYQEYADHMLAKLNFRLMPLSARGLLYSLRLECWTNCRLPSDPSTLASLFGCKKEEVIAGMQWLDGFFNVSDGWITCPELEDYRLHLKEIRAKQSSGGKKGAAKTNAGKSQVARESVVKLNTVQLSSVQSNSVINDKEYIDKSWDEFRNESGD
mgnify:CR=1 FL=1